MVKKKEKFRAEGSEIVCATRTTRRNTESCSVTTETGNSLCDNRHKIRPRRQLVDHANGMVSQARPVAGRRAGVKRLAVTTNATRGCRGLQVANRKSG